MDKEFGVFYRSKYSSWNKIADFDNEGDAKNCAELLSKGNENWAVKVVGTIEIFGTIEE